MDLIGRTIILLLAIANNLVASNLPKDRDSIKRQFDAIYKQSKKSVFVSKFPNSRRTQLYSRNSGRFIQVLRNGKVVAKGTDGNKYADLQILTVSFGKVHIKGLKTSFYICFDKRGRLIAKRRPTVRCIFREQHGKDAYTMYESEKYNGKFIAFNRKGVHRYRAKNKVGTKTVQFVERPRSEVIRMGRNPRYYKSHGKKHLITSWELDYHKQLARETGRLAELFQQSNSALNPLHSKKHTKKKGKNKHRTINLSSSKSDYQKQDKIVDGGRFPPKQRLRSTNEKE